MKVKDMTTTTDPIPCLNTSHNDHDTNHKDDEEEKEESSRPIYDEDTREGGPQFEPRLYVQRYQFVADVMEYYQVKSVVDFGSAECKIFRHLRHVNGLERVYLVDIDAMILEANKTIIRPIITDYIGDNSSRIKPLKVDIMAGDITVVDDRIRHVECVSMVEIIEHFYDDTLQAFPPRVFGEIQPRMVIITTPNSEFNVLFPRIGGFRHWDHKFEWTRREFQQWCNQTASTYGYAVSFHGIGSPPSGSEHLGHCSQAAVFQLQTPWMPEDSHDVAVKSLPYELIRSCIHPCRSAPLSYSEQLKADVIYYINFLSHPSDSDWEGNVYVPIDRLLSFMTHSVLLGVDTERLTAYLREEGYKLTEDGKTLVVVTYDPHYRSDTLDDSTFSEPSLLSDSAKLERLSPPECWDDLMNDDADDVVECTEKSSPCSVRYPFGEPAESGYDTSQSCTPSDNWVSGSDNFVNDLVESTENLMSFSRKYQFSETGYESCTRSNNWIEDGSLLVDDVESTQTLLMCSKKCEFSEVGYETPRSCTPLANCDGGGDNLVDDVGDITESTQKLFPCSKCEFSEVGCENPRSSPLAYWDGGADNLGDDVDDLGENTENVSPCSR